MNIETFKESLKEFTLPRIMQIPYFSLNCSEVKAQGLEMDYRENALYNFRTGKIEILPPRTWVDKLKYVEMPRYNAFARSQGKIIYRNYFKYIDKLNMLCVMLISFDTSHFKYGEKRKWKIEDYFFIDRQMNFYYKNNKKEWVTDKDYENLKTALPFSYCNGSLYEGNLCTEATKLFGVIKSNSNYTFIDSTSSLTNLITNYPKDPVEEKVTKKLKSLFDQVISKPLKNVTYKCKNSRITKIAVLDMYDKDISVIRWFKTANQMECYEYMRFYVTTNGNFLCDIGNDGNFHLLTKNINKNEMVIDDFIVDKEKLKDSKFKYFFGIIEDHSTSSKANDLYEICRFELIEKFAKTGLDVLTKQSLSTYRNSRILPYTTIGNRFSVKINAKETDIYKALGLNKYQYKKVVGKLNTAYEKNYSTVLRALRILFKHNEFAAINDIDNDTFDKFYDLLEKILDTKNYYCVNEIDKIAALMHEIYSLDACYNGYRVLLYFSNSRDVYRNLNYLRDYIKMVYKMKDAKSFPLKFSELRDDRIDLTALIEEVKRIHDAAVNVYNLVKETAQAEEFAKKVKNCEKWLYTDGVLSVVAPTKPGDLAREGIELHHCVKSYIDKVVDGKTNILFIRKNCEIEKPFFTVEVGNKGTIEQVHGFANRNANTEPGLEDFIDGWAKKTKLHINSFNKVR